MSKKKFSFEIIGREIFASEQAIVDTLTAKYGEAGEFVTPKLSVKSKSSIRAALRKGQPRETAFFGDVQKVRESGVTELIVRRFHPGKAAAAGSTATVDAAPEGDRKAGSRRAHVSPRSVSEKASVKQTTKRAASAKSSAPKSEAGPSHSRSRTVIHRSV
ncbi:hypothetical protein [Caballeronia humi]|uniref:hypothetical protein n=1 Tax=Caballeronia humi TaxID=326474 RepID=UPI000F745030|nr:hypothetical protein [Caballeronia humi]